MTDFIQLVQYIVSESVKLKNKYTDETDARIEFCDIFSRNNNEYRQLTEALSTLGKVVYNTPTGDIYSLNKPIETSAGFLHLIKIRKSDLKLKLRGDADFNTDYKRLKEKYLVDSHFELIIREKFEMLRLSDTNFNVMACFSNIPVRKWIYKH